MLVYGCAINTHRKARQGTNLDTPNTEFHQGSEHFPSGDLIRCPADGNLDEETVVVGLAPPTSITASMGSDGEGGLAVIWAPAKPELASNRTPFPPALR